MKKLLLFFWGILPVSLGMFGQEQLPVRFVNKGKMYVAPNPSASIYVPWSVKTTGQSSIVQKGKTCIAGSFYQSASTNAFKVGTDGWGTDFSDGVISFMKNTTGNKRYITVGSEENINVFDRSTRYVAFPNVLIDTDDQIILPERMGMDARTVKRGAKQGVLYLSSNPDAAREKVFDASLRITGNGTAAGNVSSNNLVDRGAVIVERDMSIYRSGTGDGDASIAYGSLFTFAPPFEDQKAGYFSGNYVRSVSAGANNNPQWHARYPFADETGANNVIKEEYFVRNFHDLLVPSQAYIVVPKRTGANDNDIDIFVVTAGNRDEHAPAKYIFDGNPFAKTPAFKEQVFAQDRLISRALSGVNATTYDWVIGNSYTCAIDAELLAKAMMNHPGIYFYEEIWVYPPGSTSLQPYQITNPGNPQLIDLTDIPSQTAFMIRIAKGWNQSGTFNIDRRMLSHGKRSHNLRSAKQPQNELLFRVSPAENANIYDLAAVGLRSNTSTSVDKVEMQGSASFQIYTTGTDNRKKSINLLDLDAESVPLSLKIPDTDGSFVLDISRIESMTGTEGVWLKDMKTGQLTDLTGSDSYQYTFDMSTNDDPDRFVVYFKSTPTRMDEIVYKTITCSFDNNELVIGNLYEQDINSLISITDMSGRIIRKATVTAYPEMRIPVTLAEGVYIAKLSGKRNAAVKFTNSK